MYARVAVAVLAMPGVAVAAPRIAITAGSCPSRDAMIFALAQVVPTASIVPTGALLDGGDPIAAIAVSDDGPSYQVQVGTTARTFFDPTGRCEERADKAAVVVALALEPPQFAAPVSRPEPPAAVVEPRAPAAPAGPAAPSRSGVEVWFEAGGATEWSRRPEADTLSMNEVNARLAVERGHFGLALGAAWSGWISGDGFHYEQLVERDPIELLARVRQGLGPVAVVLDVGPAVVIQRSYRSTRATEAELDVRADARLELRSRWGYGVYAAVTAAYTPHPLGADPFDTSAMLPTHWIGAGAGLMLQVR
jgi:hypothetical protein